MRLHTPANHPPLPRPERAGSRPAGPCPPSPLRRRLRNLPVLPALLLAAGCSVNVQMPELPPQHPANPSAEATPLPAPSPLLDAYRTTPIEVPAAPTMDHGMEGHDMDSMEMQQGDGEMGDPDIADPDAAGPDMADPDVADPDADDPDAGETTSGSAPAEEGSHPEHPTTSPGTDPGPDGGAR